MSDRLTEEKVHIIEKAQNLARERLAGGQRTTQILSWDDGDFRVDVISGFSEFREHIVYRSNPSSLYPESGYYYMVDTVDCSEVSTTFEREKLE